MTCDTARQLLPLLLYGELAFDDEESLEQHLAICASCRTACEQESRFHANLDRFEASVPPGLLAQNRRMLMKSVALETEMKAHPPIWKRVANWLTDPPLALKPVGAMAMLALGFGIARWQPSAELLPATVGASVANPSIARVRYVSNEPSGRVKVAFDEVRPREVEGAIDDESIRKILLAAAKDPMDPGIRVESIDLLKAHTDDEDVRKALLNALQGDKNSGVRLKALEGLKPYAKDVETRRVLRQVLMVDDNPAVRARAIDLLVENREPETAGVLQELLRKSHEDEYIRARCQRALSDMKASMGTF